MKALSMMQPYAWLFANGILTIDDRSWPTGYRGPLAIHASKGFQQAYYDWLERNTNVAMPSPGALEAGGIVGVANLVDCLNRADSGSSPPLDLQRSHFGQPGYYGFVLACAKPVAFVPYRGNVRLFDLPAGLLLT